MIVAHHAGTETRLDKIRSKNQWSEIKYRSCGGDSHQKLDASHAGMVLQKNLTEETYTEMTFGWAALG